MDTFNFSFFEDDPNAPKKSAGEKTAAEPESDTPTPTAKSDDDPFGFDAFDPQLNDADEPTSSLDEPNFDLETSKEIDLNFESPERADDVKEVPATASDTTFPDMSFDLSDFATDEAKTSEPESETLVPDTTFDLDSEETPEPSDTLALDEEQDLAAAEDVLALDLIKAEPSGTLEVNEDAQELDALEILPDEPSKIRASVVPAAFLTHAPAQAPQLEEDETLVPTPTERATVAHPREKEVKAARYLTVDDPFGEVAPPRERLRVAILGASGIGKNHARWFAKHSCDVVSFLGSSGESVELTSSHLQAHMGFEGKGYTDLAKLLVESQPQAVCISSPPELHYDQAMQCMEAGVHVLCEKPLVYDKSKSRQDNVDAAKRLQEFAYQHSQVFAPQLQYGAATPILCRLAGVSPYEVGDFAMEVETTNARASRDPKQLWIDLAPHTLSVAQYLAGEDSEILSDTVQLLPTRSAHTTEVTARFGVRCEGGRLLMCRAIVRCFDKLVDNREPRRRFSFNGRVVQYSGVKSPDGMYISQYVAPDGYISHYADPVDYLIGNFVRTCWDEDELLMSAQQGVQNLDWLLSMSEKI